MAGKMPPTPPPMETRSLPSVERATVHPSSGVPTTSSSGTNTSLKKTSLKSALPVIWRNGRTSTPGACMSMTIVVMPACFGASGLVRTVASPRWQYWAPLVHTFCPLTIQPPSTRVPRVVTAAASDPASGSLNSWHQTYSPMSVLKTQRSTWSGVAYWFTVMMFHPVMPRPGTFTPAARSSSSITICSTAPAARPQGPGQCGTSSPVSTSALRCSAPRSPPIRSASARTSARIASASAGRSSETSRVVPRAASAVTSSASSGEPSTALSTRARRRKRCASCSQVNPMPPCTWMFICALCTAGAKVSCAAMAAARSNSSAESPEARAASHTAAVASSAATSMSAQWCLTAWKVPIVRPNCTRSLA